MRTARLFVLTMGLALAVTVAYLVSTGGALADEPPGTAPVTMTFEQPEVRGEGDGLAISVRITSAAGEPIARRPVEFFVTPDFMGERPVSIRTALTNADGVATVPYTPTWEGKHRITARYAGDETYQPTEATSTLQLTGVPSVEIAMDEHLSVLRQWATPGAVAVVHAVWLVLAAVPVRVGWGVWRAGRRGETKVSPVPEAEGLPGAPFGR